MSEAVQLRLMGEENSISRDIPLALILQKATLLDAVNLCIDASNKKVEAIANAVGTDPGNFSKMRRADGKHFPTNALDKIMVEAGNVIPLIWQNHRHGFAMVRIRDEKDAHIAQLEAKLAEQERELAIVAKWFKQVRG